MWQTIKNFYHFVEALLANIIYGFPGKKLRIIGVTGTDGKTTTVTFIYAILRREGRKAAMITTVEAEINGSNYDVKFHPPTFHKISSIKSWINKTLFSKETTARAPLYKGGGVHGTTPSAFAIQKFLYDAARAGATHAVLEVSSHGLDQFRVWGIPFEIGVLTNITHEHFDYHKTLAR